MINKKISMIIPDFREDKQDEITKILGEETFSFFSEIIVLVKKEQNLKKEWMQQQSIEIIEKSERVLQDLNKAFKMAQGNLIYVQSIDDSLDLCAVKSAVELLTDNFDKINISFFPQNKEDKSDMAEGLYHVMLEQKFTPGVFNFVVKKECCKVDEGLLPRCAYLKLIMDAISQEGYFGYTKQGCQKHGEGIFDPYKYEAINSYEAYSRYYDFLLEYMGKKYPGTSYASWLFQGLLIKSLDEVLMRNLLIPDTYTEKQKEVLRKKIQAIMDFVEIQAIVASKKVGKYHLVYLSTFRSNKMVVRSDAGRFGLYDGEDKLFSWNDIAFHIIGVKQAEETLCIRGSFQNPISSFVKINYFLVKDGVKKQLQTRESKLSYRNTPQKISDCREYVLELPYHKSGEYYFEAEVLNNVFPITLIYNKARAKDHEEEKILQTKGMEVTFTFQNIIRARKLSLFERCKRKIFS